MEGSVIQQAMIFSKGSHSQKGKYWVRITMKLPHLWGMHVCTLMDVQSQLHRTKILKHGVGGLLVVPVWWPWAGKKETGYLDHLIEQGEIQHCVHICSNKRLFISIQPKYICTSTIIRWYSLVEENLFSLLELTLFFLDKKRAFMERNEKMYKGKQKILTILSTPKISIIFLKPSY